jgi:sugar fermentation stimulation protein A
VRRPNRFLIIAADPETGEELACHCPNPGSIAEFTIPGTRLILERRPEGGKTAWTAAAVRYEGRGGAKTGSHINGRSRVIVPLYSARANEAAATLVLPELFPRARKVQPEYTIGGSRFDFFVEDSGGLRHLIEIKACSLVEYGIAMFPDAPSVRALKHLEELAGLSLGGYKAHVIFMIMHGWPERFIPNLHSDPAFAAALGRNAGRVDYRAYSLNVDENGIAGLADAEVPFDLSHTELAELDSGSYLITLKLEVRTEIAVGGLGTIQFEPGWYVYCGSARKSLSKRVARHRRKTGKALHWHIDYLVPHASTIKTLPTFSYENLECDLAAALIGVGGTTIPRFGSTDCGCPSHLYRFETDPMKTSAFLDILFLFRHRISLGLR